MAKFFKKSRFDPKQEQRQDKRAAKVASLIIKGQRTWADFMARQFARLGPWSQKLTFAFFILGASIYFAAVTFNAIQGGSIPVSVDRIERPHIAPLKRDQAFPHELDSLTAPPVVP